MKSENHAVLQRLEIYLSDALGTIEKEYDSRLKELSDERDATKTRNEQCIKELELLKRNLDAEREKVASLERAVDDLKERLGASEAAVADGLKTWEVKVSTLIAENDDLKERLKDSETKLEIIMSTVLTTNADNLQKVKAVLSNQHPDRGEVVGKPALAFE